MFAGIRIPAILWGIAADMAATTFGIAVLIALATQGGTENLPEAERAQLLESLFQQTSYLLLAGTVGLAATGLGGYVAARVARVSPLLNAACVGLFDIAFGLYSLGTSPLWFSLLGLLLTWPAAITGGVLWRRQHRATAG